VRLGVVVLPELPWSQAREQWQQLDVWGYHSAWTYDHLAWRSLADGPWYATVPTLAAAALATTTIRLGTFVASPNFRHPVPFAKELMSLDDLSGGRVQLGGPGLTARQRVERFAEFVELLDRLLSSPLTSYDGEWFTARDARMHPGCVQQPRVPFVVAANGPRAMRVVARHGQAWVTTGVTPPEEGEQRWWAALPGAVGRLDDALTAEGRDPASVQRYLSVDASGAFGPSSVEHLRDVLGRAESLRFDEVVVHWPRPDGVYAGDVGVLERAAAELLPELEPR
jgi:alkanesulfonate monooxygenase SsuD/methylene tetrahydromethanopterin reductase-like flavin-dependent oxidoreductase (luciferase family)